MLYFSQITMRSSILGITTLPLFLLLSACFPEAPETSQLGTSNAAGTTSAGSGGSAGKAGGSSGSGGSASQAGAGSSAGNSPGGASGAGAGGAGGKGGSGGAGQAGEGGQASAGHAGDAGSSGSSGQAGTGDAGAGGDAGSGGAGEAGSGGVQAGSGGEAGQAGAGAGGDGGGGAGGDAAGQGGAGAGQGGAGQGGAGAGGAGAGGAGAGGAGSGGAGSGGAGSGGAGSGGAGSGGAETCKGGSPPATQCDDAIDGLVSWWHADSAPKGRHRDVLHKNSGTVQGGVVPLGAGKQGKGWLLTGGGFIEVPNSSSLNFGSELTLEAWVQTSQTGSIFAKISPGGMDGFQLDVHNDKVRFLVGWPQANSVSLFPYTEVAHVVAVYDGKAPAMRVYINGNLDFERTDPGVLSAIVNGTTALRFGSNLNADGPSKWKGLIDEARIYKKALSAAQVQGAYSGASCAVVDVLRWDFSGATKTACPGDPGAAAPGYTEQGAKGSFSHTRSGCDTGGGTAAPFVTSEMNPTDGFPYAKIELTKPLNKARLSFLARSVTSAPYDSVIELSSVDASSPTSVCFSEVATLKNSPGEDLQERGPYLLGDLQPGTYYIRIRPKTDIPTSVTHEMYELNLIGVAP